MNKKLNVLITAPLDFMPNLFNEIDLKVNLIYKYKANYKTTKEVLIQNKFDAWLCSPCPEYLINEEILSFCPSIKFISTPSTGTNHIDLKYLKKNNINYFSLQNSKTIKNIYASSEFTFCLLISVIRKLPSAFESVKSGKWREVEGLFRGRELAFLKVGIIGYGRIGSNLSKYCKAFNMEVSAYDPYVKITDSSISQEKNLNDLLNKSDIVVVSTTLNEETFHMIDENAFNAMKNGSYFINTSRGDVVVEEALIHALKSGKILAAGIDVISDEFLGNKNEHPLIKYSKDHDNLIITPHIAGLTYESEIKAQTAAFEAIINNFNDRKNL